LEEGLAFQIGTKPKTFNTEDTGDHRVNLDLCAITPEWLIEISLLTPCGSIRFPVRSCLLRCMFTRYLVLDCWKVRTKVASPMNSESAVSTWPVRSGCRWFFDGEKIELGYRIDLVVENIVIVEVKSVDAIHPVHQAQLLSYMRLSGIRVGLLINFYVTHMRDGIKRMVDGRNWEK